MQTIVEHARATLTADQLAAIDRAIKGESDVCILLTREQVAAMATHLE